MRAANCHIDTYSSSGAFLCLLVVIVLFSLEIRCDAQCCAGGSGSPIAGGASQGVLCSGQIEVNTNIQHISTSEFLDGSTPARDFLDNFNSQYLYSRVGYGILKDLTMSVECGYWFQKTQIGLRKSDTSTSTGFGDLILFPRYTLYSALVDGISNEITVGLGYKIPLGSNHDSARKEEPFSHSTFNVRKPLAVQLSTGARDIIFYGFFFRGYREHNINLFANALYIHKGWNSFGEKIGDFASVSLFASTQVVSSLGALLQIRAESLNSMSLTDEARNFSVLNYDPDASGYKKVFVSPQLNYTFKSDLTIFVMTELPVYQYVTKTQIASQYQVSLGLSYRFYVADNEESD